MRHCPRDHAALAKEGRRATRGTVEVDVCPTCAGLFLDKGEIRALTGSAALHRLLTKRIVVELDSSLRCPNCKGTMEGENAGPARVDVCLDCFGVWLDPGELERLMGVDPAQLPQYSPQQLDEVLTANGSSQRAREEAIVWTFRDLASAERLGRLR